MTGPTLQPLAHLGDIEEAVDGAVEWVFDRLDQFSLFDESDDYDPSRLKSFAEFAIMLATRSKLIGLQSSDELRAVELLKKASTRPDFIDWIIRAPDILVQYVQICAALRSLGFDSPELTRRIQSAVDVGLIEQLERFPHRSLELRLSLDWAGITHSMPATENLISSSILGGGLCSPLLSRDTVYAVTHVIMFSARFGMSPRSLSPDVSIDRVRGFLCDLLVAECQAADWDVLGELLLCWDCLGFPPNPLTSAAWSTFLSARTQDGSFLGRPLKNENLHADGKEPQGTPEVPRDGKPTEDPDFDTVYHTTLVAILAGTVHLHGAKTLGVH